MRKLRTQQAEVRRRAERFLKWAEWHVAHRGSLTDERCAARLSRAVMGTALYLVRKESGRHKGLVNAVEEAMPGILAAKELLLDLMGGKEPLGALRSRDVYGKISKSSHALTRALIKEGL